MHTSTHTTQVVELRQTQQATALDLRMAESQLQSSAQSLEARSAEVEALKADMAALVCVCVCVCVCV